MIVFSEGEDVMGGDKAGGAGVKEDEEEIELPEWLQARRYFMNSLWMKRTRIF